jgi:acyl-CoA synthetase (AMP-forming)/AMP-acid ligase II
MLNRNIAERFVHSALGNLEKTALVFQKQSFTYEILLKQIVSMAKLLDEKKDPQLDMHRMLIVGESSLFSVVSFWSGFLAGYTVSLVSSELPDSKLAYIEQDLSPHVLATNLLSERSVPWKTHHRIGSLPCHAESMDEVHAYLTHKKWNLDLDLASILYTSGSSGVPKGVMLTHGNMLAALESIAQYLSLQKEDVILNVLPLSFDYGLYQMIMAFTHGCQLVLEKNLMLPMQAMGLIKTHRVTVVPFVPSMITLFYDVSQKMPFSFPHVLKVTNTGAAMTPKHFEILKTLFPSADIFSMYGLTECKRCSYLPPEYAESKQNSVGIAIPNTEIWIADEHGRRCPPHTPGELVVRGSTVMLGYWNKPEETEKKLKPGKLPYERVLMTGDLAQMDEEGFIYLLGRKEEMIKSRGQKVSPIEVESLLSSVDEIHEVSILGIEDAQDGEQMLMCFSSTHNITLDAHTRQRLKQAFLTHLEPHQRPQKISLLTQLPKSHNGKVDKLMLKNWIKEGSLSYESL